MSGLGLVFAGFQIHNGSTEPGFLKIKTNINFETSKPNPLSADCRSPPSPSPPTVTSSPLASQLQDAARHRPPSPPTPSQYIVALSQSLTARRRASTHSPVRMALPHMIAQFHFSPLSSTSNVLKLSTGACPPFKQSEHNTNVSSAMRDNTFCFCTRKFLNLPSLDNRLRRSVLRASRTTKQVKTDDWKDEEEEMSESDVEEEDDLMNEEERREWRKKIREVIDKYSGTQEEIDPEEKRMKMQKLLKDYPLVVDEEDPDWPEDADGRGFSLDQFFNKITIKNVKKDDVDDDSYDSDNEVVWQDDDFIRPIKDITTADWEETVFKDISPLIILVHNRYKRPKDNERCRDELEKAVNIIWNCRLPSPRCVAIDAVIETDLVSALQVSVFPELIFTKAGKVLYREKAIRTPDELSKIMAFFYYGAAKPTFFNYTGDSGEVIPFAPTQKL